jgi:hypothetical protein
LGQSGAYAHRDDRWNREDRGDAGNLTDDVYRKEFAQTNGVQKQIARIKLSTTSHAQGNSGPDEESHREDSEENELG